MTEAITYRPVKTLPPITTRLPQKKSKFTPLPTDHGGELRKKRSGRKARSLTCRHSLHLVLRSSKARGRMSFTAGKNRRKITEIVYKHAARNGICMISFANVGNHLHLHIQLASQRTVELRGRFEKLMHRDLYKRFIRSITGAIALAALGASPGHAKVLAPGDRFWDQRPFTRYVATTRHFLKMKDYMEVNRLEGQGFHRINARLEIAFRYDRLHPPDIDDDIFYF